MEDASSDLEPRGVWNPTVWTHQHLSLDDRYAELDGSMYTVPKVLP